MRRFCGGTRPARQRRAPCGANFFEKNCDSGASLRSGAIFLAKNRARAAGIVPYGQRRSLVRPNAISASTSTRPIAIRIFSARSEGLRRATAS